MRWFLYDGFKMLELRFVGCPNYGGTWNEQIAVCFYWLPWHVWWFLFLCTWYFSRTMFHWLLWTGISLLSMAEFIANLYMPHMSSKPAACSDNTVGVSAEAAIVVYIACYYFMYYLNTGGDGWISSVLLFSLLISSTACTILSLLALEVNTLEEIMSGSIMGAVFAVLMALFGLLWVEPRVNTDTMRKLTRALHVDLGRYGNSNSVRGKAEAANKELRKKIDTEISASNKRRY